MKKFFYFNLSSVSSGGFFEGHLLHLTWTGPGEFLKFC